MINVNSNGEVWKMCRRKGEEQWRKCSTRRNKHVSGWEGRKIRRNESLSARSLSSGQCPIRRSQWKVDHAELEEVPSVPGFDRHCAPAVTNSVTITFRHALHRDYTFSRSSPSRSAFLVTPSAAARVLADKRRSPTLHLSNLAIPSQGSQSMPPASTLCEVVHSRTMPFRSRLNAQLLPHATAGRSKFTQKFAFRKWKPSAPHQTDKLKVFYCIHYNERNIIQTCH